MLALQVVLPVILALSFLPGCLHGFAHLNGHAFSFLNLGKTGCLLELHHVHHAALLGKKGQGPTPGAQGQSNTQ